MDNIAKKIASKIVTDSSKELLKDKKIDLSPFSALQKTASPLYDVYDKYVQKPTSDIASKIASSITAQTAPSGKFTEQAREQYIGTATPLLAAGLEVLAPDPLSGVGKAMKAVKGVKALPKVLQGIQEAKLLNAGAKEVGAAEKLAPKTLEELRKLAMGAEDVADTASTAAKVSKAPIIGSRVSASAPGVGPIILRSNANIVADKLKSGAQIKDSAAIDAILRKIGARK
jgi:hypothetical protein